MSTEEKSDKESSHPAPASLTQAGANSVSRETSLGDTLAKEQAASAGPRSATGTLPEQAGDDGWSRLKILDKIASGGMGTVFKAMHSTMERECAVKVLSQKSDSDTAVKRFFKEARLVCSLDHANIVKVFSFGFNHENAPYFVMELLEGNSLDQILKRDGRLKLRDFLPVFTQVLNAIDYAHHRQVVHRDLKPANIFLANGNEPGKFNVKLMDFGIAQIVDADTDVKLTKTGALLGTPLYMSPEQTKNEPVDHRSDIYSIGAIMYEAFVGTPPFSGDTALDVMYKHANQALDETSMPQAASFKKLRKCIIKCLEKDPNNRFQSIADLRDQLEVACDGLEDKERLRTSKEKYNQKLVIAVVAVALVTMGAWFMSVDRQRTKASQKQARSLVKNLEVTSDLSSDKCESIWKNDFSCYEEKRREGPQKVAEAEQYRQSAINACKSAIIAARREMSAKTAKVQRVQVVNRPYNTNLELVKLYLADKNFAEADAAFKSALEDCPKHHNLRCSAMEYYIPVLCGFGRTEEALSILQDQIKTDQTNPNRDRQTIFENSTHLLLLAQLYMRTNRLRQAETLLQKVKAMNESSFARPSRQVLILVLLAKCSNNDKNKLKEAVQACEQIIDNGADEKHYDEMVSALDLCAQMIETVQPDKARIFYKIARQPGMPVKDPQQLANALRDSCGFEIDNKNSEAVDQIIHGQRLSKEAAISLYQNSAAKDIDGSPVDCEKDFAEATANLLQGGNTEDVITKLKKCFTESVPGSDANARSNWMLGRCYHKIGMDDKALSHFSAAIEYPTEFVKSRHFLSDGISECVALFKSNSMTKEASALENMGQNN